MALSASCGQITRVDNFITGCLYIYIYTTVIFFCIILYSIYSCWMSVDDHHYQSSWKASVNRYCFQWVNCFFNSVSDSVKLLLLQFTNKCWNIPISYEWRRASNHQEELKSANTEFTEGQWEHERSRTLQNETHWRTKRLVLIHSKMKISPFTLPQAILGLCDIVLTDEYYR